MPAGTPEISSVVSPVDHKKVNGATPPETLKSTVPVESSRHKISCPDIEVKMGTAKFNIVTDKDPAHPLASSTSTVYAPAGAGLTSSLKVALLQHMNMVQYPPLWSNQ